MVIVGKSVPYQIANHCQQGDIDCGVIIHLATLLFCGHCRMSMTYLNALMWVTDFEVKLLTCLLTPGALTSLDWWALALKNIMHLITLIILCRCSPHHHHFGWVVHTDGQQLLSFAWKHLTETLTQSTEPRNLAKVGPSFGRVVEQISMFFLIIEEFCHLFAACWWSMWLCDCLEGMCREWLEKIEFEPVNGCWPWVVALAGACERQTRASMQHDVKRLIEWL